MGTSDKLSEVIAGSRVLRFHQLDAASEAANAHWRTYLARNVRSSQTLTEMQGVIRGFENSAPRVLMSKCIDGRVHGSDREGYPPTTITFFRTDGNRVMLSPENVYFWNRLNGVILAARRQTPGCPALFIAYGHFATLGRGCAAHAENKEAAMAAVMHQAQGLRERFEPEDLYVLHGMTNTDDGAETLIFSDGRSLDAAGLIDQPAGGSPRLESPCDVFQGGFLDRPFDDPETDRIVGGVHPRILLESGSMFEDLRLRLATEAYLLRAANLAGHAAWDRGARTYRQDPKLDDPRGPDFLVFVYGGGFVDKDDPTTFRPGFSVPPDAPPAFFVVAHDDGSNPTEAAMLYLAYKKLELSAELHVYAKGGHGFGMMQRGQPIDQWPTRVAEWLASMGLATIADE